MKDLNAKLVAKVDTLIDERKGFATEKGVRLLTDALGMVVGGVGKVPHYDTDKNRTVMDVFDFAGSTGERVVEGAFPRDAWEAVITRYKVKREAWQRAEDEKVREEAIKKQQEVAKAEEAQKAKAQKAKAATEKAPPLDLKPGKVVDLRPGVEVPVQEQDPVLDVLQKILVAMTHPARTPAEDLMVEERHRTNGLLVQEFKALREAMLGRMVTPVEVTLEGTEIVKRQDTLIRQNKLILDEFKKLGNRLEAWTSAAYTPAPKPGSPAPMFTS